MSCELTPATITACRAPHARNLLERLALRQEGVLAFPGRPDTIGLESAASRRPLRACGEALVRHYDTILEGKAAYAGRRVVAVPPAFTSQDCSGYGQHVPKSLSVRSHVCIACGLVMDRDEIDAKNIQWARQALRGLAGLPAGMNRASPAL